MGRREDVLHGKFVQQPDLATVKAEPAPAPPALTPVTRHASADSLQALLAAIKQDLKNAAQI